MSKFKLIMMKSTSKLILSLVLVIVFLLACGLVLSLGFVGAWLHTYRAFTERKPVAQVTLSEQKEDEFGKYVEVEYKPVDEDSALVSFITGEPQSSDDFSDSQNFKLYGDTVHVGGPMIKFRDELILFNFDSIYKVGKIFSRYNIDNEAEINRNETQMKNSSFDLNGGIDSNWKNVHDNLTQDNLEGRLYREIIDTTQLDVPGQFVSNKPLTYTLYITNNGFIWELNEN